MKLPVRILKWLEKHPKYAVFLFILYTLFIGGAAWVVPMIFPQKFSCNPELHCSSDSLGKGTKGENEVICITESFSTSLNKWDTSLYRRNSEGYWCPKEGWEDPVMWYKDGLLPDFEQVNIDYEVISDSNNDSANPPSFIFTLGNEIPLLKIWTPEGENLQLFRSASNKDLDRKILTDDQPGVLSDPVKPGETHTFLVERNELLENGELLLNFSLKYKSNLTDTRETNAFPKKIEIPSLTKTYQFGIGTFFGNCIKPESYKICQATKE